MDQPTIEALIGIIAAVAVAAALAAAGSAASVNVAGLPVFALCALLAFVIQWIAFVPAYIYQTERYYDLVGSLTHLSVVACALLLGYAADPRSILLALLIAIWAVRLGTFLFARVRADGFDRRFSKLKPNPVRFLMAWTTQGLWVFFTLAAALAAMTASHRVSLGAASAVGVLLWGVGFAIEVVADRQKRAFRANSANKGSFISSGLWAWSRHPNYFGEILLWLGIAVIALPALTGWQWVTLLSPVFVYVLLTRISGIPMLEASAERRWGDDPDYQAYKAATPVLIPRPPSSPTHQPSSNS